MKILIGLHDSEASRAALDYVRMQNWPAGSKALLLAAHEPTAFTYTESYSAPRESVEQVFDDDAEATRSLLDRAEGALRDRGLETETRLANGDPREAIVGAARDEHADLIVVGARERSALSRVLQGSVAAHVVAHAPCNVLVVKHARSSSGLSI